MKTPMQELADKLYELSEMHASDMYKAGMRDSAIIAETMLEKEKGVIMDAHHCGRAFEDKYPASDKHYNELAEEYYNETFNNDDQ